MKHLMKVTEGKVAVAKADVLEDKGNLIEEIGHDIGNWFDGGSDSKD